MGKDKKQKAAWGSSSNMWRDPKTTKKSGCPLALLALLALPAGVVAAVAELLG